MLLGGLPFASSLHAGAIYDFVHSREIPVGVKYILYADSFDVFLAGNASNMVSGHDCHVNGQTGPSGLTD